MTQSKIKTNHHNSILSVTTNRYVQSVTTNGKDNLLLINYLTKNSFIGLFPTSYNKNQQACNYTQECTNGNFWE